MTEHIAPSASPRARAPHSTIGSMPRDRFTTVHGRQAHDRRWGADDAPAVLLLHGLTGNAWEWDPIAATLANCRHVLALDQRGHGWSDSAPSYAVDDMVEDIAGFVRAMKLDRVSLVGHSMGGINAFTFAGRYPSLVDRLVIVDIGPESLSPEAKAWWRAYLPVAATATYLDPEAALLEWLASNPRAQEQELRHFIVHNLAQGADGQWRWRYDATRLHTFFDLAPSEEEQWASLRQITSPTLVIRGAESTGLREETAASMVRILAQGELIELSDGGHDLTVEQPRALAEALRQDLTPQHHFALFLD